MDLGDLLKSKALICWVVLIFLGVNFSYGQESAAPVTSPGFSSPFPSGLSSPGTESQTSGQEGVPPEGLRGKAVEEAPEKPTPEKQLTFPLFITAVPGDTYVDVSWPPLARAKVERFRLDEPVSGYIISYGTESGRYTEKIDVGDVSGFRIRNLRNHTPYFLAVKAYTRSRELTAFSNEVRVVPKPQEELKSTIERVFSEEIPQVVSKDIVQFGYDLFSSKVSSFAPVTDVPVGPDYVVGPGDSFIISLWGRLEARFEVGVDRNGEITLPKAGVIKVWGLTFSELKQTIYKQLSKYYSGFQMNITMDKLRTIRVFIVGEAQTPGSYTLSSLSTVYSALFAAGGPSKRGTMRNIQLMRNGKVLRAIDLYDFLLKGDKSQDERLQSGDTIFIPVIGPVAGITGNVKRPAIYEVKTPMTLQGLIDLAGGVTFLGYLQRVQVERVEAHQKRVVADFDVSGSLKTSGPELKTLLRDGDLVKIFPVLSTTRDIVYLEGHVKRPGGYEFKKGMTLLDLISSFDQLLPEPYLDYAEIIRLVPPDFHSETVAFDLGKLLRGDPSQDIALNELDRVTVFSRESLREIPQITIGGEVQRPGKYRLLENMRVKDLIFNAGNLKRSAYLPEAEITRLKKTEKGVTPELIKINVGDALKNNPEHNILLEEDDYLFVRQIPEWYTDKTVILSGELKFPGEYSFSNGERLSSIIERGGGVTEYAYLKGAFFTRGSAKRIQEERIRSFIDQLEQEILKTEAQAAEAVFSEKEVKGLEQSLVVRQQMLRKLREAKVTGRVVMALDSLEEFKGSKYDLVLEDGDTLTIPKKPGIVNVLGSVYNPTSIIYTKGKNVDFYLNLVGGPTPDAEEDEIYVIKADGTVISKTQKSKSGLSWDSEGRRWVSGGFMASRIEPGDTVLVPTKITRFMWKKELMDWTTILFQIAVSAGVIIAAF
ncbi:MAG TPA: SLBB domain-containing protein [Desulfatiglandales bacterium]|nr:SLBB domain-containing protein [Desulfatiglandales bacterium]